MKRWIAVVVASAALLASTGQNGDGEDPIIEDDPVVDLRRTDAGLEVEVYSVRSTAFSLEGVMAQAGEGTNLVQTRSPDAGDPWLDELVMTPRSFSTTASQGGATASASLEVKRLTPLHYQFVMGANASAPDGNSARALAGFEELDIVVYDKGLTGVKVTTSCTATKTGGGWAEGAINVVAGETLSGDTMCANGRFKTEVMSGVATNMSPSDDNDTTRKYATIYMDIGLVATTNLFGDLDAGTASATGTVDVVIEPLY